MGYHSYYVWFMQPNHKNPQKDRVCRDKEEQVAPQRLLQIHQVSNWVRGLPKMGPMDLIFIDAKVKINGAYYILP